MWCSNIGVVDRQATKAHLNVGEEPEEAERWKHCVQAVAAAAHPAVKELIRTLGGLSELSARSCTPEERHGQVQARLGNSASKGAQLGLLHRAMQVTGTHFSVNLPLPMEPDAQASMVELLTGPRGVFGSWTGAPGKLSMTCSAVAEGPVLKALWESVKAWQEAVTSTLCGSGREHSDAVPFKHERPVRVAVRHAGLDKDVFVADAVDGTDLAHIFLLPDSPLHKTLRALGNDAVRKEAKVVLSRCGCFTQTVSCIGGKNSSNSSCM